MTRYAHTNLELYAQARAEGYDEASASRSSAWSSIGRTRCSAGLRSSRFFSGRDLATTRRTLKRSWAPHLLFESSRSHGRAPKRAARSLVAVSCSAS
jgi:hypothetical protein